MVYIREAWARDQNAALNKGLCDVVTHSLFLCEQSVYRLIQYKVINSLCYSKTKLNRFYPSGSPCDICKSLAYSGSVLHNSWTNSFSLPSTNIQPSHNLVIFGCPDVSLALGLPYE